MVTAQGSLNGVAAVSGNEDVRNVTVRLEGDSDNFVKAMEAAEQGAVTALNAVVKFENAIKKLAKTAGNTMMTIGAVGQGLTGWATTMATKWEDAYSWIEKSVDAPPELAANLRKLSTEIPVAAEKLASLGSLGAQLGVDPKELDKFTEVAARMGAAIDMMSPEEAIIQLSQFASVMGLGAEHAEELASSVMTMGKATSASENDIFDFSQRIAGIARVAGIAAEEVIGIASAFSAAGIRAERGGTAVSKVIQEINQAATQGGEKLKTFSNALGMSTAEFKDLVKEDPSEAFIQFVESLKAAGDDAFKILEELELTDSQLVQSFLTVANSATDVRTAVNKATKSFKDANAVNEQSDKRFNTLINTLKKFKQSILEIGRSLGQYIVPIIKFFVEWATKFVNLFHRLPDEIKGLMGLMLGLGSAVLLVAGAMAKLVPLLMTLSHVGMVFLGGQWMVENGGKLAARIADVATKTRLWQALVKSKAWERWFGTVAEGQGVVGLFVNKVRNLVNTLSRLTWHEYRQGLVGFINVIKAGAKATVAFMAKWAPIALAIGAAIGIFMAFKHAAKGARGAIDGLADATENLGESMGLHLKTLDDYASALENVKDGADSTAEAFAFANGELLAFLETMSSEEARRQFLMSLAFRMADKGATPTEIQETMDMINEVLPEDKEVNFKFDFKGVKEADSLTERMDAFRSTFEGLDDSFAGMDISGLVGHSDIWGLRSLFDVINIPFRDEHKFGALEEMGKHWGLLMGQIAQGGDDAAKALQSLGLQMREVQRSGASHAALKKLARDFQGNLPEGAKIDVADAIFQNPEKWFIQILEDDKLRASIRQTLKGLGVADALLGSPEEIAEQWELLLDRAMGKGAFILPDIKGGKFAGDEISTLEQMLGETYQELSNDKSARAAFFRDKMDELVATEGHEKMIKALEDHLDSFKSLADAYANEEGRKFLEALKRLKEEFADIQFDNLKKELEGLDFTEAIAKLDELADSGKYTAEQLQELESIRAERINKEVNKLVQLVEQEERLNERRDDMAQDHQERMQDLAEDHAESMDKLNEQERKRLRDHTKNLAETVRMDERMYSQYALGLERIIMRSQEQNVILEDWAKNLAKLRQLGLNEDVISTLGLDDPQNFNKVDRIIQEAMASPELIETINAEWAKRLDIMGGEVQDGGGGDKIRKDFDERAKDMQETFEERQAEMLKNHREAMGDIAEDIASLGEDTAKNFEEAVKAGLESASPHIRELAKMLEEHVPDSAEKGGDKVEKEFNYLGQEVMDHYANNVREKSQEAGMSLEDAMTGAIDNVKDALTGEQSLLSAVANSFDEILVMGAEFAEKSKGWTFDSSTGTFQASFPSIQAAQGDSKDVEQFIQAIDQLSDNQFLAERISNKDPKSLTEAANIAREFGAHESHITEALSRARKLALGAMVNKPTHAIIGESGPEAVIPLNARGANFMADVMRKSMPRSFGGNADGQLLSVLSKLANTMQATGGMRQETTSFGPITVNAKADVNEIEAKLKAKARQRRLVSSRDKGFADG